MIVALTRSRLINMSILERGVNQHSFIEFLLATNQTIKTEESFKDKKWAFIFDNAAPHKAYSVRSALEDDNVTAILITPHSP